jgi:non-specific serine/threonine protein kinase
VLLVLDDCEHVVEACARLAESLLRACGKLRIVATSREALGVTGEAIWHIPSLALPPLNESLDVGDLLQYEAIQLFVDRATLALPSFKLTPENAQVVAQICARLDGIPLALELAAARVKVLKVEQIATRLDDCFRLLTSGSRTALPRQQTLRATMDWSWDLLTPAEQALWRRLAVFTGGWTLEAAEAVCIDEAVTMPSIASMDVLDVLTHLVDKSLVNIDDTGEETRYTMLEMVRQYGHEKLVAAGENEQTHHQHTRYYLQWVTKLEPQLRGALQTQRLDRLETEHDNLRAATEWAWAHDIEAALRFVWLLYHVWHSRSEHSWRWEQVSELLARPEAQPPSLTRAQALSAAGAWAYLRQDYSNAKIMCDEVLALGNAFGLGRHQILAQLHLGRIALEVEDFATARLHLHEALTLARVLQDPESVGAALNELGGLALAQAQFSEAQTFLTEGIEVLRALGEKNLLADAVRYAGYIALHEGDVAQARAHFQESLALNREIHDVPGIAANVLAWANIARREGRMVKSVKLLAAVQTLLETMHVQLVVAERTRYSRTLAAVRAPLDDTTFDASWLEGCQLNLEQAIALAQGE